jgi:hypothetical protein
VITAGPLRCVGKTDKRLEASNSLTVRICVDHFESQDVFEGMIHEYERRLSLTTDEPSH